MVATRRARFFGCVAAETRATPASRCSVRPRPDGVREAAPLAHVAPQAGRDAAAENLGRDPRGRDERMAERDRRPSHEKVRLLEVRPREMRRRSGRREASGPRARRGPEPTARRARPREKSATRRSGSNAPAAATSVRSGRAIARNRRDEARVREASHGSRPCRGSARRARARARGAGGSSRAGGRRARPRASAISSRMTPRSTSTSAAVNAGAGREVEEEVHGLGRPFRRHARVERDALLRRVRVAVAAEPVGDPRDGGARAAARPLEEEVLEKVRRAALAAAPRRPSRPPS